jgi:hypothetical protein
MTGNRSKGACIWLALAAISFASLARVQSGVENARAYADPVIKFFAAGHLADSDASAKVQRAGSPPQAGSSDLGLNLLPIFFVGLVAPLVLQSLRARFFEQRVAAAPSTSTLFQRPPPYLLA